MRERDLDHIILFGSRILFFADSNRIPSTFCVLRPNISMGYAFQKTNHLRTFALPLDHRKRYICQNQSALVDGEVISMQCCAFAPLHPTPFRNRSVSDSENSSSNFSDIHFFIIIYNSVWFRLSVGWTVKLIFWWYFNSVLLFNSTTCNKRCIEVETRNVIFMYVTAQSSSFNTFLSVGRRISFEFLFFLPLHAVFFLCIEFVESNDSFSRILTASGHVSWVRFFFPFCFNFQ